MINTQPHISINCQARMASCGSLWRADEGLLLFSHYLTNLTKRENTMFISDSKLGRLGTILKVKFSVQWDADKLKEQSEIKEM